MKTSDGVSASWGSADMIDAIGARSRLWGRGEDVSGDEVIMSPGTSPSPNIPNLTDQAKSLCR